MFLVPTLYEKEQFEEISNITFSKASQETVATRKVNRRFNWFVLLLACHQGSLNREGSSATGAMVSSEKEWPKEKFEEQRKITKHQKCFIHSSHQFRLCQADLSRYLHRFQSRPLGEQSPLKARSSLHKRDWQKST